jgi:hypothetical protein
MCAPRMTDAEHRFDVIKAARPHLADLANERECPVERNTPIARQWLARQLLSIFELHRRQDLRPLEPHTVQRAGIES